MNNNYPTKVSTALNNELHNYYIVFTINDKQYAVAIKNVLEIINLPEIEIPEQTPKGIIGLFNYNGLMIKVIDLCPFLGFETNNFSIANQVIIATVENTCIAIHTNKIDNVFQFDDNNIQNIPYDSENSVLKQIYKTDDNSISIIDIKALNNRISSNRNDLSTVNYSDLFPKDEKSIQILKLRAKQHKENTEAFSFPINIDTSNQYILFMLDNQNYYLDLKYVKEFISIKRLNITKIPYTQEYIKGIINVKGEFLVVLDLKKFLNNSAAEITTGSKLIIAEGQNFNIALLVDEIKYIKTIKNIPVNTINANTGYISSEILEDNILYNILNFEKIINDEKLYININ